MPLPIFATNCMQHDAGETMSNVVKFKRPPKPQEPKLPRKPNPALRKLVTVLGIVAAFVLAWAYFQYAAG